MSEQQFSGFPTLYPSKDRPTRAEINLSALEHNYRLIRTLCGEVKMMAMVKAEAYGHGLLPISAKLVDLGVDYLGVSFLEEGIALRQAGLKVPILVMGGLVDEQIDDYLDYDLEITVSSVWKANQADAVAGEKNKKAVVHLKVDTGMGRIGQQWNNIEPFFETISRLKNLEVRGIYSHFASSDEPDGSYTSLQLERFTEVVESAKRYGIEPDMIHVANSGAILQFNPQSLFTLVRPGIMLYGVPPHSSMNGKFDLRPVMTLKTSIVYVKRPLPCTRIGYGSTYICPGDRWIATLPIGYGDGYPRRAGNKGYVVINRQRCPIVGRVSMDMMTVDCGSSAYLGDTAILFGGSPPNDLPIWDVAELLDTIPYELTTCLTPRVPRIYING